MYKVDLNSDLGESFGAYTIGSDDRVLALVSSANVACGFHAGDPSVMGATVAACGRRVWRWAPTPGSRIWWGSVGGSWR